jgi:PAS domain S-box-containing protein
MNNKNNTKIAASHEEIIPGKAMSEVIIEHLPSIFDRIPIHIGFTDKTGLFSFWNAHSQTMFGYHAEEVVGKLGYEIIYPTTDLAHKTMQRTVENGEFDGEVDLWHRSGTVFPGYLVVVPLKNKMDKVIGFYQFAHNFSQQKKKQQMFDELKIALKVCMQQQEEARSDVQNNMLELFNEHIYPYLNKIKTVSTGPHILAYLEAIETNITIFLNNNSHDGQFKRCRLTPTEFKVSQFIIAGKRSKDIARMMDISTEAVEFHRKHIRDKIGIHNRKINLRSQLISIDH